MDPYAILDMLDQYRTDLAEIGKTLFQDDLNLDHAPLSGSIAFYSGMAIGVLGNLDHILAESQERVRQQIGVIEGMAYLFGEGAI